MEQLVRVRAVYPDGTAQVIHIRESACSGDCHKCSGCGAAKEAILLKAKNPIGAPVGSLVRVESETGPVLKAAAVLYVLPLVLFFVGYALGSLASLGALCGCAGFAVSVAAVVWYDRALSKKGNTEYTITGYAGNDCKNPEKKGDNDLG